jgi:dihydrofolate reductase
MTRGRVFIATSLDGFIARTNGDIDWLPKPEDSTEGDYGYDAFVKEIDGIVMGRGTFETVRNFSPWPYPKPVIVMSRSLGDEALGAELRDRVTVSRLGPSELMHELSDRGWKAAYVDGGQVIQSFLHEGLIDDMVITCIPVLIGAGRPLFGPLAADIRLEHLGTQPYPSGMVQSRYRVRR